MKHKRQWLNLLVIALLLALGFIRFEGDILIKDQGASFLSDQLEVLDFESGQFVNYEKSGMAGTLSEQTYYFRLTLNHVEPRQVIEIAKPQLALVHMVETDKAGKILLDKSFGRSLPFASREVRYKNYVSKLEPSSEPVIISFEVKTDTYLQMPIYLWDEHDFVNHVFGEQVMNGVFYGMLLVMLLYNLALGLFLKDRHYLYYVGLIGSYLILQMVWDGSAFQYLWPDRIGLDMRANPFFINLASIFLSVFTFTFLQIDESKKKLTALFYGLIGFGLLVTLATFTIKVTLAIYLAMATSALSVVLIISALYTVKLKRRSEQIFLLALALFLIGNVLNILAGFHIMPYTVYTMLAPKVGTILMLVLFSLALGDRIKEMEIMKGAEAEKAAMLKELHELNKKIVASRDISRVAKHVIDKFVELSQMELGCMIILDPNESTDVTCYMKDGSSWALDLSNMELSQLVENMQRGEVMWVASNQMPYLGLDKSSDLALVPLVNFDIPIGVIVLSSPVDKKVPISHQELLKDYASQVTIIIGNIKVFDEIYKNARVDDLTQIYNRRGLFELLRAYYQIKYEAMPLSLLMIDIDYFKKVNDTYGHTTGDQVLARVAAHMSSLVEGVGEVGRYGGEEFLILLPNIQLEGAMELAERIRQSVAGLTYLVEDKTKIKITISIGVAERLNLSEGAYELCDKADRALYEAKLRGRDQVVKSI